LASANTKFELKFYFSSTVLQRYKAETRGWRPASALERMLRRTRAAVTAGNASIFLLADGLRSGDGLPHGTGPDVDGVFLNALTVVEPFHGEGAVEDDGRGEADFKRGNDASPPARSRKCPGCHRARRKTSAETGRVLQGEIVAVAGAQGLAELLKVGDVRCPANRRGGPEPGRASLRPAADRFIIGGEQLVQALERGFVVGVPEPVVLAQGCVASTGRQRR